MVKLFFIKSNKSKLLKKNTFMLLVLTTCLSLVACTGKKQREILERRIDSLQVAFNEKNAEYDELNGYLTEIAEGLDSISIQEGLLFNTNNVPGESPSLNRKRIKQNLKEFQNTLNNQRLKIEELEKKLASGKGNNASLQTVIASLKSQLASKDAEIKKLQTELNKKNLSVKQLQEQALALQQTNTQQTQTIAQQEEALKVQDAILNEGYIKIGSKKELLKAGILKSGGFLKKSTVSYADFDLELFDKVDIRYTEKIEIPGKKPKILTPVPADAYELETSDGQTILHILSPDRFWSASTYLIIQTN